MSFSWAGVCLGASPCHQMNILWSSHCSLSSALLTLELSYLRFVLVFYFRLSFSLLCFLPEYTILNTLKTSTANILPNIHSSRTLEVLLPFTCEQSLVQTEFQTVEWEHVFFLQFTRVNYKSSTVAFGLVKIKRALQRTPSQWSSPTTKMLLAFSVRVFHFFQGSLNWAWPLSP